MTCPETRDLFSARADDALDAEERARLDAHLGTCADCAREWRRFESTVGLLRAVEPARAPAGFVDRVMAARPRPWYRRLARGLLVPWPVKLPLQAAAVVLIAGLAIVIFQRSPDLQQAARAPEMPAATRAPEPPRDAAAPVEQVPASTPQAPPPARQEAPAPGGAAGELSADAGAAAKETRAKSAATSDHSARLRDSRANEADVRAERQATEPPPAGPMPPQGAPATAPPAAPEPKRETSGERLAKQAPVGGVTRPGEDAAEQAVAPPVAPAPGQKPARVEGFALRRDARVAALAQIEARLATPDRSAAERDVRALVARLGGVVTSGPESLDLVVPRAAWDELARELGRLGTLRIDRRQAELPSAVRVTLRLE